MYCDRRLPGVCKSVGALGEVRDSRQYMDSCLGRMLVCDHSICLRHHLIPLKTGLGKGVNYTSVVLVARRYKWKRDCVKRASREGSFGM